MLHRPLLRFFVFAVLFCLGGLWLALWLQAAPERKFARLVEESKKAREAGHEEEEFESLRQAFWVTRDANIAIPPKGYGLGYAYQRYAELFHEKVKKNEPVKTAYDLESCLLGALQHAPHRHDLRRRAFEVAVALTSSESLFYYEALLKDLEGDHSLEAQKERAEMLRLMAKYMKKSRKDWAGNDWPADEWIKKEEARLAAIHAKDPTKVSP
jgi:hypothetical protein